MTLAMRMDFLRELLLKHLTKDTKFPTDLPKSGHALQVIQFTQFRQVGQESQSISGIVSDKFTSIACQFSAECCNEFEANTARRFTEIRGGLIRPVKWELNVMHLSRNNKYKAVVRIDQISLMGSEGENTIGDPRDFNSYRDVVTALGDPRRQSIYEGGNPEGQYGSQRNTPQSQNQTNTLHQSKRRKLAKEDHPTWTEVKNLKFKDYQITHGQQDLLATNSTWFTPDNIAQYQTGLDNEEQPSTQQAPQVFNGQDHPPLSSPEEEHVNEESQFHTQAPAAFGQSQIKGEMEVEETVMEEETLAEKVLEWELTPQPETQAPRFAIKKAQEDDGKTEVEEPLEWEESPPRPKKTTLNEPPPLDSDEEVISKPSPLHSSARDSEEAEEEPRSSPPVQIDVVFEEDREERTQDDLEDEIEGIEGLLEEASMNVSTGALLTQYHSGEKDVVAEVVEITETVVIEKEAGEDEIEKDEEDEVEEEQENVEPERDEEEGEEVDAGEIERMDGIGQSEVPIPQQQETDEGEEAAEPEFEEEVVEASIEITETVQPAPEPDTDPSAPAQPQITQSQSVLSTTQDESTTSHYPASSPSIPAPPTQDSQIPSNDPTQVTPAIPSTQPPITLPPPSYLPTRESSPPKRPQPTQPPAATPQPPIPPSAQIQVHETPFAAQKFNQHQEIPFTSSNTRISATAPAAISPDKPPAEEAEVVVQRHRRDRHIGPVVPKFSRRERKTTYDLEAMLIEDLKEFYGAEWRPVVRRRTPTPRLSRSPRSQSSIPRRTPTPRLMPRRLTPVQRLTPQRQISQRSTPVPSVPKGEPMEEIIQESYEEKLIVEEKLEETDLPSSQPSRRIDPNPPEIPSSPTQRSQSNEPIHHETQRPYNNAPLSPEIPSTQDDSQTFDAASSRWGRFAAHWRRFSTT